ncbi:DEAD/DEAH box helicase [Gulosibacter molinativorax]|uniref:ATP-dependent helicase n=1 Tax=Gulosibacter molinativorax TaxID=256821 RepID=A0ABT7CBE8_9MICO|nr:DEAD/DEAH box helicase [Gulosibacter molinativorax]MDJ1372469.1 ATP-dependent helicase [Gulosibacter molinativorax]
MTSTTFAELGVPADLVAVLEAANKATAFPIQQATLPSTLAGKDVLGRGKTGSGKTLAFSIPLVARVAELKRASGEGRRPKGLVLLPTRELATQVANVIAPLAAAKRLSVTTVFGGVKQGPQERAFRNGVDIVVACPGRLDDLMKQGIADLGDIEVTVLDEADHMADLGFLPVVTRILNATPAGRQRLLFSATLDNGVDKLVKRFLNNPTVHSVDEANSPVAAMTHHVYEVESTSEKTKLVRTLASGTGRRILFMRTKHQAKKLARQLTAAGIPAVDLHGNLSQNARDRNLAAFSGGDVRVLVATDVAARGVHVDGIELVVHVDPPAEHKAYLHRSGRTARAGAEGDVVTIMLPEQRQDTKQLLRRAQISVQPRLADSQSPFVLDLVGEQAPHVAPVPGGPGVGNEPVQQAQGTSNGANARRKRAARSQRGGGQGAGATAGAGSQRGQQGASRSGGQRSGAARSGGQRGGTPRGGQRSGAAR